MGKAKSTGSSERDVTASRGTGSDRDAFAVYAASRGTASPTGGTTKQNKRKRTDNSERDGNASRGSGSDRDACAFYAASRGSASKRMENVERDGISLPPQDVQVFDGQKLPAASGSKDSMDCFTDIGKSSRGSELDAFDICLASGSFDREEKGKTMGSSERDVNASRGAGSERDVSAVCATSRGSVMSRGERDMEDNGDRDALASRGIGFERDVFASLMTSRGSVMSRGEGEGRS